MPSNQAAAKVTPVRVIFIHGNGGATCDDAWLPSCAQALQASGLDVVNQTFPDNRLARARYWLPEIERLRANHQTIIVGHSSGAVAALRYAETHRLFGLVLVGVCHTDLGEESERISGYYNEPWQWDSIIANVGFVQIFASTDDPYIPIAEQRFVAQMTDAELKEFSDRGHFLQPTFPELTDFILEKTDYPEARQGNEAHKEERKV